jgi:hypothetical protein
MYKKQSYDVELYADSDMMDQIVLVNISARAFSPDGAMDEALLIARGMFRDDVTFTVKGAKLRTDCPFLSLSV